MIVPLLDLKIQYQKIKPEVLAVAAELFESQQFILGEKVRQFEEEVAAYCGAPYAIGVSSGTDALVISLMAADIRAGDLVVTTPYTFFATAGSIARVGARPLFVDIDADTYNMDPGALRQVLASLNGEDRLRVKALMPVHLFGQCADMESIGGIAREYGLVVIEDAAQALGAEYMFSDGTVRRAGAMGDYGCFSFFPSKNLGAFGDGGLVTTDTAARHERLDILRMHGSKPKYYHALIGGNFRLDALQAAILSVKLKYLDEWTAMRQANAALYRELFARAGLEDVRLPVLREKRHIFNQFVIEVPGRRDELREFLNAHGVGCEIYYPVPLHMQACFAYLGYAPQDFPVSGRAADTTLALPIYPELTPEQQAYVVGTMKAFFGRKK